MPDDRGYKTARVPPSTASPPKPRLSGRNLRGELPATGPPTAAQPLRRALPVAGAGFTATATAADYAVGPGFINPVDAQVPTTLPVMGSGFTATATEDYYQRVIQSFLDMYLSGLKVPLESKATKLMKTSPKADISADKINKPKLTIGAPGIWTDGGGGGGGRSVSLSSPGGQLIMWRIGF